MQTCDPLEARQWFNWREVLNGAAVIIGFIILDAILWPLTGGFVAGTISIVVMSCVFFFWLHKRTIGIECPHCKSYIETDTPWICGVCGTQNLRTDDFPFVGRCEKCHAKPKAYQCHHKNCGKLIFLTKDRQEINFAKCIKTPAPTEPTPVKKDKDVEEIEKLDKDLKIAERTVKKAKLDLELKAVKKDLEPEKELTEEEILEKSAARFKDRNTTGPKIVERWKAENARIYKDNPAELAKQNKNVDLWALNHLDKM